MPTAARKPTEDEMAVTDLARVTTFDLDLRGEAENVETFQVPTDFGTIEVPVSMDDWKGNAVNLIADGRFREAMEVTCLDLARTSARKRELDEQATDALVEQAQNVINELSVGQIGRIIDHVSKTGGVSAGESSGSAASSRSTGPRSRRTS